MSSRSTVSSQATIVQELVNRGVARKMARGSEADLIEKQLRDAADTLRWVDQHKAAIRAAVAGAP